MSSVFTSFRALVLPGLVVAALVGCGEPGPAPLVCQDEADGVGQWRRVELPTAELDERGTFVWAGASDGTSFVELGANTCEYCRINVLDPKTATWTVLPTTGNVTVGGARLSATPDFLLSYGGRLWQEGIVLARTVGLLDRQTLIWTVHEPPAEFRTRYNHYAFWTGRAFLLWGGQFTEHVILEEGDVLTGFYDGVLFDPVAQSWQLVPALREDAQHAFAESQPRAQHDAAWTNQGLFVWGKEPDRNEPFGALWDEETNTWQRLSVTDAPPVREYGRLASAGDEVYYFGGVAPGTSGLLRDLWRYSLVERGWESIEVPDFADTFQGIWAQDRLVFVGSCASAATYEPGRRRWSLLGSRGRPPSPGSPYAAGPYVFIHKPSSDHDFDWPIWLLDPR